MIGAANELKRGFKPIRLNATPPDDLPVTRDQIGSELFNLAIGLPFLLGVGPMMIPVELAVQVLTMISAFAYDNQRMTGSDKRSVVHYS